jgi:RNA-binding protein
MLTPKQRSYLRGLATDMQPIFQVGKLGINANLVKQVNDALEARELIKLSVLKTSPVSAADACRELAGATRAEAVFSMGNRLVLYRESEENKRIFLEKPQ